MTLIKPHLSNFNWVHAERLIGGYGLPAAFAAGLCLVILRTSGYLPAQYAVAIGALMIVGTSHYRRPAGAR